MSFLNWDQRSIKKIEFVFASFSKQKYRIFGISLEKLWDKHRAIGNDV